MWLGKEEEKEEEGGTSPTPVHISVGCWEPHPDMMLPGTWPKESGQNSGAYLTSQARACSWVPALRHYI